MNAVIYLAIAVYAGSLGVRAWTRDRKDRTRRDFALLAALACVTYLSFGLYLFPGLRVARLVFATVGAFLPVATLQFVAHFFTHTPRARSRILRQLWIATPIVAVGYLAIDLLLFSEGPAAGLPELVLGIVVWVGFGSALVALWRQHQATPYRVEQSRIRYLLGFMAPAVILSGFEGIARLNSEVTTAGLPLLARGVELQGQLPPLGALFTGLFLFFLFQVLRSERLLDLHEVFARGFSIAAISLALVLVMAGGVFLTLWLTGSQIQVVFWLLVLANLFLVVYEPLRVRVEGKAREWFNIRGHQLQTALDELDAVLPGIIDRDVLTRELLDRLHASGRIPALSLYTYDHDRQMVRLAGTKSGDDQPKPMPAVALTPFSEGFEQGTVAYARTSLERHRDKGPHIDARLTLMDGMNADLVVPLRAGDLVLGWLALKDEPWSDGFSHEEVRRISATLSRAATVIENLKGFEALKEQSRLAALGTMSAGLAHEIRNPLAGIKGAAQYLQALDAEPEELEFLDVIVSETDRLNAVVSSFLDYARHFNLNRAPSSINELVDQVLSLIHAEGLPEGVELSTSMDPDLPELQVDGLKLRQVFLNLLRNALQALPKGGRVHVSSYLGRMSSTGLPAVVVAVSDDGKGVATSDLEKLFVPFYTTKVKGTGLGLPICQRIVRAHLGELNVESQPGAGATFYVRIPTPESGLSDASVDAPGADLDPLP